MISYTCFWNGVNSLIGAQIVTTNPQKVIDSYEDLADREHIIPLVWGSSAYLSNLKV